MSAAVLRRYADRVLLTTFRACREFVSDRGHRDAAQIAFFAILSAIPLALLLIAAFGLFFEDAEVRDRIVEVVFDSVPLAEPAARESLQRTLERSLDGAGEISAVAVVLLVVAASGVMSALRHAINEAWDIRTRPPLLKRKALDVVLVLGGASILALSLSLTATSAASDLLDGEGNAAFAISLALDAIGKLLPFAFLVAVLLFLYRVLPMHRPKLAEIWPGAVVAALGLLATKAGLELYFDHFADFGALYGSLGALMALLIFTYAAAIVLVFGAEFASEWSRLPPDAVTRRLVRAGRRRVRKRLVRRP